MLANFMPKRTKDDLKEIDRKWPRRYVPIHTSGKCPYCNRKIKDIEDHIKSMHKGKNARVIKGEKHGHE